VLGPIGFDGRGDLVPAAITLARVERGGGADSAESRDGASLVEVMTFGGPAP